MHLVYEIILKGAAHCSKEWTTTRPKFRFDRARGPSEAQQWTLYVAYAHHTKVKWQSVSDLAPGARSRALLDEGHSALRASESGEGAQHVLHLQI